MNKELQELYKRSTKEFGVWSYLWIFSDKGEVSFTYNDLSSRFRIPSSTLHRIITKNIYAWSSVGVNVSIYKGEYNNHVICFKKKKAANSACLLAPRNEELYVFLEEYYASIDFDYPDMPKHKRYIETIIKKLTKAMILRGTPINDETIKATFKMFVSGIDGWWRENGNITLPLISRHFTKLLNQVKNNSNGKKRDNYSVAAKQADEIDFGKLTRKQ